MKSKSKIKKIKQVHPSRVAGENNENKKRKISGAEYCKLIAKAVLKRSDSSSVAMLREIRESTEGSKVNLSGTVKTEMETAEDRIKLFEEIVNS